MNKVFKILFRIVMLGLILFELLSGFGVFHTSLVYTWQGLVVVALFAWVSAEIIMWRRKEINVPLFLGLVAIAVLLDVCGDIFHLYVIFDHYDKFLHFFNSGVVTYLVFVVLKEKIERANLERLFSAIIIVTVSSFFGVLYEIEEFLEDVLINHKQLRLGDGFDTAGDLLANVLGCVIMTFILFVIVKEIKSRKAKIN